MKKKNLNIGAKFSIITFFVYLSLISFVILLSYKRSLNNLYKQYSDLGQDIIRMAADEINIDHISDYLSGNYDRKEYDETLRRLNRYTEFHKEVYYLYVYRINEEDKTASVIFDAYTDHEGDSGRGDALGEIYELDEAFMEVLPQLSRGEFIPPVIDDTKYGHVLTCSMPLYDSNKVCQGYILADFNLTSIKKANINFTLKLFAVSFVFMIGVLSLGIIAVSVRITKPIEKLYACISEFKYETDADRCNNIEKLKALHIHTNAEIQFLYNAMIKSYEESYNYKTEYQIATKKLGVAKEKAYTDPLTGLSNKAAFDDAMLKYQASLEHGDLSKFAVIMADINNLKYVNDNYGHKNGDDYIKGCCGMLSGMCRNSETYRVGGDEFVVILQGNELYSSKSIFSSLVSNFMESYNNTYCAPYQRFSMSLGMSVLTEDDTNVNDVVKRADSEMYAAKAKFKNEFGSYR